MREDKIRRVGNGGSGPRDFGAGMKSSAYLRCMVWEMGAKKTVYDTVLARSEL